MNRFLSCDWGTSSFRLRLVDTTDCTVVAEEKSGKGIAGTFQLWKETGKTDPEERLRFYTSIISEHITVMESRLQLSLDEIPVIVSGMASSSIGMRELPYSQLPIAVDGSGVTTMDVSSSPGFQHPLLLISGVRSADDVMRGEETQLIGCIDDLIKAEGLFIFPGTHSKHILVSNGQVTGFQTFMTGEFFELLTTKSILQANVEKVREPDSIQYLPAFQDGVRDAVGSNLLHASFRARTNELFQKRSKQENYVYVSGLLIGTELGALSSQGAKAIYLVGGAGLKTWYEAALATLGFTGLVTSVPAHQADEAVIKGQLKIFYQINSKK